MEGDRLVGVVDRLQILIAVAGGAESDQ